jgi:hypothetical protein
MQAGASVFVKAGESAECIVSCCERMHMPADRVLNACRTLEYVLWKAQGSVAGTFHCTMKAHR